YPLRVWNKNIYNAWQLYGHSHGTLNPLRHQYDVGIDNNNFYPISCQELITIMNVMNNDTM
ncbi:MAG: phosphoesterase, partial [Patescibacteria group bacterium]|nr:phosphoesterase [Patescibacteria group bacterium]